MMLCNRFSFAVVFFAISLSWPLMAHADRTDQPEIKLQALNKSTARTITLTAKVGETIEYGSLFIKTQACRKSDPLDPVENAAFLQIWEVPIGREKSEWAFSGWMFSSSPAVSAMDHPVYDVWVLDCFDSTAKIEKPVNKVIVDDVEVVEEVDTEGEETQDEGVAEETPETVTIEPNDARDDVTTIQEAQPFDTMIETLSDE